MRWIYDLGFLIFGIFTLPHFLARLRQADEPGRLVRERLGILSSEQMARLRGKRCLWIHSVSVGEVLAVERLVQLFLGKRPDLHLVLTTVTPTGQRIAKRWEGKQASVLYFPFDVRFAVRRFLLAVRPIALLLVETEIWPNVIMETKERGIPIGIVNGRLSGRSYNAFRRFAAAFRPITEQIDFFLVQTEKDRGRWLELGVSPERVRVTGNMKLDLSLPANGRTAQKETLRRKWGFLPSDQVLIAGSTHEGEEAILFRICRRLREEGFPLKLLVAPRHIERSPKLLRAASKAGLTGALAAGLQKSSFTALILDKMGELRELYGMADAVFMGGSLVRRGGQNPVEPASFACPILHGPSVFNFEEIYGRLDEEGGALRVESEEGLLRALRRVLQEGRERESLGRRAYEILEKLRGATGRNFACIEPWVQSERAYENAASS